jgi:endonuclease YncB( thermonuclease family)
MILLLFVVQASYGLEGRVVSVTDGDTIKIVTNDKTQYRIRLYGIDAPEKKQPYGKVSQKHLSDMVSGKIVEVVEVGRDLYGRTIGKVYVGGEYVNAMMVWAGMAWHYCQYASRDKELKEAQRSAQSLKYGLWADPSPVSPWDFRKKH